MALTTEFKPLELSELRREAAVLKADGWRFIQTHAVNTDAGVDLYYSFMKDGHALNYRVEGVTKDRAVPSITDLFLAAFVFENEARELFGVDMRDIAIDFDGMMYAPAENEPMTFISPEQKAAKDKARKAAATQAAKASGAGEGAAESASAAPAARRFELSEEKRVMLEERLATMSPDKVAKVREALAAREAEAAAGGAPAVAPAAASEAPVDKQAAAASEAPKAAEAAPVDAALEEKIAGLPPEKAAKVRAALAGRAGSASESAATSAIAEAQAAPAASLEDAQLEQLLSKMDEAKAAKVRAALGLKEGE